MIVPSHKVPGLSILDIARRPVPIINADTFHVEQAMKITAAEKKRRRIRWQQGAAKAADAAHSKKAGYNTRPKPSMPKMPWDDEPATVERHLARGRAE